MLKHARARGRIGRIVASVNPLVPKPGTAYQWLPMVRTDEIERKMKRLRDAGRRHRQRLLQHQERAAFLLPGAAVARRPPHRAGDRARRSGTAASGAGRVADAGVDGDFYIYRDRSTDAVLPWDIIDGGMKDAVLPRRVREEPARGVDAAAQARQGERAPAAGPELSRRERAAPWHDSLDRGGADLAGRRRVAPHCRRRRERRFPVRHRRHPASRSERQRDR